jgi:hypothetical protein
VFGGIDGKSFIKIENRSGPRIDPCGTPKLLLIKVDVDFSMKAAWDLFDKYLSNYRVLTPRSEILCKSCLCSTLSKAFQRFRSSIEKRIEE